MYLRLMLATAERYDEKEIAELRATLTAAPGVTEVRAIERHPRGGYAVHFEHAGAPQPLLDHLAAAGYRGVL